MIVWMHKCEIARGQNMSYLNFSFVYRKALLYKEWRSSRRQIIDARNENKIRNLKQFNHEKFLKISCLAVFISRGSNYFISLSSSGMYGIGSSFESIILISYNFASFSWSSTNSSLSASNLLIMSLSSSIVWSFFIFTIFNESRSSGILSSSISSCFLLRGFFNSLLNLPFSSKSLKQQENLLEIVSDFTNNSRNSGAISISIFFLVTNILSCSLTIFITYDLNSSGKRVFINDNQMTKLTKIANPGSFR